MKPDGQLFDLADERQPGFTYSAPAGSAFPPVLDACCGGRAMWFDRADGRALYVDKRSETVIFKSATGDREHHVRPDIVADFTSLPFPSDTFALVVFDPPHVQRDLPLGNLTKRYGCLNGEWRDMLRKGFAECFRVLRPDGVLVFKWSSVQFPLRDILALTPEKPLFGHQSGMRMQTHWVAFLKQNAPRHFPARSDGKMHADVGASGSPNAG